MFAAIASYFAHRRDCAWKQDERREKLARLPAQLSDPTPAKDELAVRELSLAQLVDAVHAQAVAPSAIVRAYGKRAILAHARTNCLADVLLSDAAAHAASVPLDKPLSGVPVSIKDCIDVAGCDTTLGFSANARRPAAASAPLVRLLQDAGAQVLAKTALPTACLSFECSSDLFGPTTNPYGSALSPGASTGGGAALLAYGGSMVELGTDLGGSVRYPAAWCGLYAIKGSHGRFPSHGSVSCCPGMESVPSITAPMARSLEDLREFWRRVFEMRPWEYDHTCVPLPWRPVDYILTGKKLKWGVMWDDGIIPPTPANVRALKLVVSALRAQGHTVVDYTPPAPLDGLKVGYQLMFSDGGASITERRRLGEYLGPALRTVQFMLMLPLFLKRLNAWLLRVLSRPRGRNDAWAALLAVFHGASAREERRLVEEREAYRAKWHGAWRAAGLDFMLTVPHALPGIAKNPAASGRATLVSANYAFLYNLLDVVAGVVPVTYLDAAVDSHPAQFRESAAYRGMNDIARGVHDAYDAKALDGVPLAVQVVGGRMEEERVLAGMAVIEHALGEGPGRFVPRTF